MEWWSERTTGSFTRMKSAREWRWSPQLRAGVAEPPLEKAAQREETKGTSRVVTTGVKPRGVSCSDSAEGMR